jgi:hypothetical protein
MTSEQPSGQEIVEKALGELERLIEFFEISSESQKEEEKMKERIETLFDELFALNKEEEQWRKLKLLQFRFYHPKEYNYNG